METFGLRCWGCDSVAPDEHHLQLDHVEPKEDDNSNHLHKPRAALRTLQNGKGQPADDESAPVPEHEG